MGLLEDLFGSGYEHKSNGNFGEGGTKMGSDLKSGDWIKDSYGNFTQIFRGEDGKLYKNDAPNIKDACFITTAVCKTLNKPDDCTELTKFRYFRDTFMRMTPEMQAEIEEYYEIAPKICSKIGEIGEQKAAMKYASIWENSLKPAFDALENGEQQKAYNIYKGMVLGLKREYL